MTLQTGQKSCSWQTGMGKGLRTRFETGFGRRQSPITAAMTDAGNLRISWLSRVPSPPIIRRIWGTMTGEERRDRRLIACYQPSRCTGICGRDRAWNSAIDTSYTSTETEQQRRQEHRSYSDGTSYAKSRFLYPKLVWPH